MAILIKGTDFTDGDQVTAVKLDALVDSATFASGAVDASTTALSGGAIIVKDLGITAAKLETATNGQLMIGNGTGFTKAALTAGTNIAVTNASGAVTLGLTGTVAAANGGTGAATLTANNVLLGNGTSAVQFVAPGSSGNLLTSNGTTWASSIPSGGISSTGATITTNTTLTAASPGYQPIAMTALGKSVTLPDATTVLVGSPKFYFNNASGVYPVGIRNTSGTLLMAIAAGGTAFVSCQDITTAAGVWNITGDNLEPGLITIDSTFSSTYTSTRLLPFVAFDSNKSLHFLSLSSGFAAVAVDNTTGAVGTPVTVSATASMVPRSVFLITSTTAIVFYSSSTGTLIGVVISLSSATTLTVGTSSSTLTDTGVGVDNFSGAPKIAQLAATLYLVSYATAMGAGNTSVAAFQVSGGTTVNLGTAVNIIAANNVSSSTTTYGLTSTTGLVIYLSAAATPYTISAVVVSVTNANPPVCTVGTPQAGGTRSNANAIASCLLSSTKALVAPDTNDTIVGAQAFTISGTTVTAGAVLTVEATASLSSQLNYATSIAGNNRYRPVLFPLTATTVLFSYFDSSSVSRAVILTESGGTLTAGTILYNSISLNAGNTMGCGLIMPQGTGEFLAVMEGISATTAGRELTLVPHKISSTTITSGASKGSLGIINSTVSGILAVRFSSGDYVIGFGGSSSSVGTSAVQVVRSNGDYINNKGSISTPTIYISSFPIPAVASNRVIFIGLSGRGSTINANTTFQMRLLNVEIAA